MRSAVSKKRKMLRDYARANPQLTRRVNEMYRMIETKESGASNPQNIQCAHNNVTILSPNPIATSPGTGDPMSGLGNRIGDQIKLRGMKTKFFLEGSLQRSKVYFRVMLLKGPRGAAFTRADIYKGAAGNKMLDDINTEKYTVVAQKIINVTAPNATANTITGINGVPLTATVSGITGNRIISFWIPGRKFGRNGVITYENGSTNCKFFDYKWVVVAYDWYGTPEDTNNVGVVNEMYSKIYFKDA